MFDVQIKYVSWALKLARASLHLELNKEGNSLLRIESENV